MSTEMPPAKKIKVEDSVPLRPFENLDSTLYTLVTKFKMSDENRGVNGGLNVGVNVQYTTKTNERREIRLPDMRFQMNGSELQTEPMFIITWNGKGPSNETIDITVALNDLKTKTFTWGIGIKFSDYFIHMGDFDSKNNVTKRCRVYKGDERDEPLGTTTRITFRFGPVCFST